MDLLQAIDERQLALYYQGIFAPVSGELRGAEALIRWEHPVLGILAPGAFLPADMAGGLGWALTNFAIAEAVRQCCEWRNQGSQIGVSVNISPGRLADEVLPIHIASVLSHRGLPADALTVEITEQRCNLDPEGIKAALVALARLGVKLSLDDFGTGDSSLSRLRHLHFDEIKLDRQFVSDLASRLACDARVQLVAEGSGSAAMARSAMEHTVPFWLRRQLRRRDGGCRWHGCRRTRGVHARHIVWFSKGGPTVIDNLVLLCRRHHRAVHEGGWGIAGDPEGELRFIRPDGRPLDTRPPPLREDMRDRLRSMVPSFGAIPRLAFDPG